MSQMQTKAIAVTKQDHDVLQRMNISGTENGMSLLLDNEVRAGLCDALSGMGAAISELVTLLRKYDIAGQLSETDSEDYRQIMESICHSAGRATHEIERSHQLDLTAYLAVLPETYTTIQ
jgi:hypothetical protein